MLYLLIECNGLQDHDHKVRLVFALRLCSAVNSANRKKTETWKPDLKSRDEYNYVTGGAAKKTGGVEQKHVFFVFIFATMNSLGISHRCWHYAGFILGQSCDWALRAQGWGGGSYRIPHFLPLESWKSEGLTPLEKHYLSLFNWGYLLYTVHLIGQRGLTFIFLDRYVWIHFRLLKCRFVIF